MPLPMSGALLSAILILKAPFSVDLVLIVLGGRDLVSANSLLEKYPSVRPFSTVAVSILPVSRAFPFLHCHRRHCLMYAPVEAGQRLQTAVGPKESSRRRER